MAAALTGKKINLREILGEEYHLISSFIQMELGISLEKLEEEVKFFEPDLKSSKKMAAGRIAGSYVPYSKEIWIRNFARTDVLVHELVHAIQYRRQGIIAKLQKQLAITANAFRRKTNCLFFYRFNTYEREAKKFQKRYMELKKDLI